jgi:hypothetical protein
MELIPNTYATPRPNKDTTPAPLRNLATMKYALLILAVLVVVAIAYYLMRKPSEPIPEVVSTYEGRPEEHTGDKILLVAVYAKWASVWRATAEVLSGLDTSRSAHRAHSTYNVCGDSRCCRDRIANLTVKSCITRRCGRGAGDRPFCRK